MLGSGLNSGVDPTQVDQEVRSALRRPVLTVVCILAFIAFGIWYFTGGSANGSSHQAEQLILTNTNPYGGNFTNGANVQTVNCTQESQSLAARLRGFISPGDNHGTSTSPSHLLQLQRHRHQRRPDAVVRHLPTARQPRTT